MTTEPSPAGADRERVRTARGAYALVADDMRHRFASGEFPAGSMLPSEAALAAEYGIARSTLHRALEQLQAERLIVSRPGKGHVVATPGQELTTGPEYQRIAGDLRAAIVSGTLEPGAALPSEAALAAEYGVNRSTAREALAVLAGEGLIESVHGKGRFVRRV